MLKFRDPLKKWRLLSTSPKHLWATFSIGLNIVHLISAPATGHSVAPRPIFWINFQDCNHVQGKKMSQKCWFIKFLFYFFLYRLSYKESNGSLLSTASDISKLLRRPKLMIMFTGVLSSDIQGLLHLRLLLPRPTLFYNVISLLSPNKINRYFSL